VEGLKGKLSCDVGLLEREHSRASYRQHVRKRLFNESLAGCQAGNAGLASFLQGHFP
jgi:hypothetical protein